MTCNLLRSLGTSRYREANVSFRFISGMLLVLGSILSCSTDEHDVLASQPCWMTERVRVINGVPGNEAGFFRISGLRTEPDGTLYILDSGEGTLTSLRSDGDLRWQAGGEGSGPREFLNATHLSLIGDTLAIWDFGNYRFSLWTKEGRYVGVRSLADVRLPGNLVSAAAVGSTVHFVAPVLPAFSGMAPPPRFDGAIVLASMEVGVVDTLSIFGQPGPQRLQAGGSAFLANPPYAPFPSYTVAPQGKIFLTLGEEYVINVFDQDGRQQITIRGPTERPKLDEEDRRRYARTLPDSMLFEQVEFPNLLPAVSTLATTSEGTVLVRTNWGRDNVIRWDRWTANGAFTGSVMLPSELRHVTGSNGWFYGVAEDELGVQSIEIHEMADHTECFGPRVEFAQPSK